MTKKLMFLGLIAALSMVGCGGDSVSPTASTPAVSSTTSSPATASTDPPAPQPATDPATDPCEGDASCGKGVTARFLEDLSLEVTSTNTGHSNTGVVCATDGFQGPNLPATPYPWHVAAKSTSVTPFPKEQIAAGIEWGPRECERTINVQMDGFRGDKCEGHILAVVWPQDNPVTFEREPGEWEWGAEVRTLEEKWSECMSREAYLDAGLDIRPETPQEGCFKYRRVELTQTATRLCSEETRTNTRSFFEYQRCDCPGPVCELYGGEQDFAASTFGPSYECRNYGGFVCKIEDDGSFEGNCDGFLPYDINGSTWSIGLPFDTNAAIVKSSIYRDRWDSYAGVNEYKGHRRLFGGRHDVSHVTFCGCPE